MGPVASVAPESCDIAHRRRERAFGRTKMAAKLSAVADAEPDERHRQARDRDSRLFFQAPWGELVRQGARAHFRPGAKSSIQRSDGEKWVGVRERFGVLVWPGGEGELEPFLAGEEVQGKLCWRKDLVPVWEYDDLGEPVWEQALTCFQVDGVHVDIEGPKWSKWDMNPERRSEKLRGCGQMSNVHAYRNPSGGTVYVRRPCTCKTASCPWCMSAKIAEKVEKRLPDVDALTGLGAQAALVTLTLPILEEGETWADLAGEPVALDTWERGAYHGHREGMVWGKATAGPGLYRQMCRLKGAMRDLMTARAHRDWWRGSVGGLVYGIEATGRRKVWDKWLARWHVHVHLVVLLRPDVDLDKWRKSLQERWCGLVPGARPKSQDVVRVSNVRGSIQEVLKYSVKTGELTTAQAAEWYAVTHGAHLHQVGGWMHHGSNVGKASKLYAADPDVDVSEHGLYLEPIEDDAARVLSGVAMEREAEEDARETSILLQSVDGQGDGAVLSLRRLWEAVERGEDMLTVRPDGELGARAWRERAGWVSEGDVWKVPIVEVLASMWGEEQRRWAAWRERGS